MRPRNIIRAIENCLPDLRKSERKVADYVMAQTAAVIHMRIVDLAQEAHVSEPTVVRFCRAIGCDGFQDFKLALAQHIAHSPEYAEFSFTEQDSAHEYTFKVFDSTMETLRRVRDNIDVAAVERGVAALVSAGRVDIFGFGASSAVALDAQHKLFRLQINASAHSDPQIQAMSAMSLGPGDVAVAISQSGRTRALMDALHLMQESGVKVIGLVPSGSPIARLCDIPIYIDVEENDEGYAPLPSRIAHMAVIDILAVGVSRQKGPSARAHLAKLNRGLRSLRVDADFEVGKKNGQ